jgi:3-hydroxybutyryl-CoA dehydrogenase
VKTSLLTAAEKGKLTPEDRDRAWAKVRGTVELADLAGCDIAIEAITEDPKAKRELFAALDGIVKAGAIFASNTSSISITEMAAATKRPERFIGLHFFNPVPVMKLLEIVRGLRTSEETIAEARAFGERLGKATILAKDTPGFIVNLLLVPYLLGAIRAYEAGLATKEDIDTGMRLGCNHPMGPLTLLDYVGLDTTLFIADVMFAEFKSSEYAAPPLLRRMVAAGMNGRKSGRGFYDWSSGQPK